MVINWDSKEKVIDVLNGVSLFGDSDAVHLVTLVHLAVEEGPDPDGDLDACTAFSSYTLTAELLAVTGASGGLLHWRAMLVSQLIWEFLRLTEADLCLKSLAAVGGHSLLLLLEAMWVRYIIHIVNIMPDFLADLFWIRICSIYIYYNRI